MVGSSFTFHAEDIGFHKSMFPAVEFFLSAVALTALAFAMTARFVALVLMLSVMALGVRCASSRCVGCRCAGVLMGGGWGGVVGLLGVQPALELAAGLTLSGRPSRVAPVSRLSRPPAPLGWFLVVGPSAACPSLVSLSVCSLSGPEVWGRGVGWFWPRPLFGLGWR